MLNFLRTNSSTVKDTTNPVLPGLRFRVRRNAAVENVWKLLLAIRCIGALFSEPYQCSAASAVPDSSRRGLMGLLIMIVSNSKPNLSLEHPCGEWKLVLVYTMSVHCKYSILLRSCFYSMVMGSAVEGEPMIGTICWLKTLPSLLIYGCHFFEKKLNGHIAQDQKRMTETDEPNMFRLRQRKQVMNKSAKYAERSANRQ